MARIYNRDNINYSGLIGQAIQNANQTSQLYANKWQPGITMGQGVTQAGEKLQQAGWNEWAAQQNDARAQAMQQRQFEQQEKMQKAQQEFQALESAKARAQQIFTNEQNALNARKLALLQKKAQDEYNRDEWHMQYQNATYDYDAAKAELLKDPNNIDKQRAFNRAEANVIRWGDKLNYDVYDAPRVSNLADELPSVDEVAGTAGYDIADAERNLKKLLEGDFTDEKRDRAFEIIKDMNDKAKQEEWTTTVKNMGATKEDYKREDIAANEEYQKTGKVRPGYRKEWKNGKVVRLVRK